MEPKFNIDDIRALRTIGGVAFVLIGDKWISAEMSYDELKALMNKKDPD